MAHPAVPLPENMNRIRVLAAESTWMSSQLLAEALAQDCQLEVMGVEPKQAAILAAVAKRRPHVILLSSALEDSASRGFDLARQISLASPGTRIILLMDISHPSAVVEAFRCGAQGIFSRTESSKILAKCIHSVHRGQVWANSAELGYVIDALKESEPMRPAEAGAWSDPFEARAGCSALRGGRLIEPGDRDPLEAYGTYGEELFVSDF